MPSYWLWVLILGAAILAGGTIGGRLLRESEPASTRAPFGGLAVGALLAGMAFVLCLPDRFPFLPGTQLGYGALLGLGATALAFAAGAAARPGSGIASRTAASCGAAGAALVWVAVTEIMFSGDPTYALLGGLAGGLLALAPILWAGADSDDTSLWFFGLGMLVVGLGSLLSVERYATGLLRPYWVLPAVAYAGTLLGGVVGALFFGRSRLVRWGIAAATVVIGLAVWFAAARLLERHGASGVPRPLTYLLPMGWVATAIVGAAAQSGRERLFGSVAPPLAGVILIVIAFNLGGGSGLAVALAAGLPLSLAFVGCGKPDAAHKTGLWLAALGALYLAYRLYLTRFGHEFRAAEALEFGRHYVFLGLAAGLLWSAAARGGRRGFGSALAEAAALVALPLALFVVFGYDVLLGLILGFWAAQLLGPTWARPQWPPGGASDRLLPLAGVWALILPVWASFMLDQARWVRGLVMGFVVLAALLGLGLLSRGRRDERRGASDAPG